MGVLLWFCDHAAKAPFDLELTPNGLVVQLFQAKALNVHERARAEIRVPLGALAH